MLTGSSREESWEYIKLIRKFQTKTSINLKYTIGAFPCYVNKFVKSNDNSYIGNPTKNNEDINQQLFDNIELIHVHKELKKLFELIQPITPLIHYVTLVKLVLIIIDYIFFF